MGTQGPDLNRLAATSANLDFLRLHKPLPAPAQLLVVLHEDNLSVAAGKLQGVLSDI